VTLLSWIEPQMRKNININLTPEQIRSYRACPAMRVNIALAIYPFGRNKLYQLMARGELPYRKIDGATLLPTAALEALVTPKG
jgi:hypothetical protein